MKLYFIRHGDPDYKNDSLTKLGCEQAEKLSEALKDLNPDFVFQSPMGRARQTAEFCAKKWNKPVVTLDWLSELKWGDLSGDAYSSASPWSKKDLMIELEHAYPTGDSWKNHPELKNDRLVQDVEARCILFDEFLLSKGYKREGQLYKVLNPNQEKMVFFCHGGISSALIAHLLNIPFWQFISHIGIDVTSVSMIEFGMNKIYETAILNKLNDTNHLK